MWSGSRINIEWPIILIIDRKGSKGLREIFWLIWIIKSIPTINSKVIWFPKNLTRRLTIIFSIIWTMFLGRRILVLQWSIVVLITLNIVPSSRSEISASWVKISTTSLTIFVPTLLSKESLSMFQEQFFFISFYSLCLLITLKSQNKLRKRYAWQFGDCSNLKILIVWIQAMSELKHFIKIWYWFLSGSKVSTNGLEVPQIIFCWLSSLLNGH